MSCRMMCCQLEKRNAWNARKIVNEDRLRGYQDKSKMRGDREDERKMRGWRNDAGGHEGECGTHQASDDTQRAPNNAPSPLVQKEEEPQRRRERREDLPSAQSLTAQRHVHTDPPHTPALPEARSTRVPLFPQAGRAADPSCAVVVPGWRMWGSSR